MAERKEQNILTIRCPCCKEVIPVRLTLKGYGIREGYVSFAGNSDDGGAPFPDVEVSLDVDIMGLKFEGGLDETIRNMSLNEKKLLLDSYDYNKAHGVYTGEKTEPVTLDEIQEEVWMAFGKPDETEAKQ